MKLIKTNFDNLYIIETFKSSDKRGDFTKCFSFDFFRQNGLETNYKELYYSCSKKDVIRGMHFQIPPHDHVKIVFVSKGEILDVVLDLRKESPTFGQYFFINITDDSHTAIYIPQGFAHGFLSLKEDTIVHYYQSSCYNKEADKGIKYDSFGFVWSVANPILSDRDLFLPDFHKFNTPF